MNITTKDQSPNIDRINLDYLLKIPEKSRTLVDIMFIKTLKAKLPEVKK